MMDDSSQNCTSVNLVCHRVAMVTFHPSALNLLLTSTRPSNLFPPQVLMSSSGPPQLLVDDWQVSPVQIVKANRRRTKRACLGLGLVALISVAIHTIFSTRNIIRLGPNGEKASQVFPPLHLSGRTVGNFLPSRKLRLIHLPFQVSLSVGVQSVNVDSNVVTLNWAIIGDSCVGDLQAPTQADCADVGIYVPPYVTSSLCRFE